MASEVSTTPTLTPAARFGRTRRPCRRSATKCTPQSSETGFESWQQCYFLSLDLFVPLENKKNWLGRSKKQTAKPMELGLKIRNLGPQKFNNFRKLTFVWLKLYFSADLYCKIIGLHAPLAPADGAGRGGGRSQYLRCNLANHEP